MRATFASTASRFVPCSREDAHAIAEPGRTDPEPGAEAAAHVLHRDQVDEFDDLGVDEVLRTNGCYIRTRSDFGS